MKEGVNMRDYSIEEEMQGEREEFLEAFEKLQDSLCDCVNTVESLDNSFVERLFEEIEKRVDDISYELSKGE